MDWEEQAYAHSPCGWVVVRPEGAQPGLPVESAGEGKGA